MAESGQHKLSQFGLGPFRLAYLNPQPSTLNPEHPQKNPQTSSPKKKTLKNPSKTIKTLKTSLKKLSNKLSLKLPLPSNLSSKPPLKPLLTPSKIPSRKPSKLPKQHMASHHDARTPTIKFSQCGQSTVRIEERSGLPPEPCSVPTRKVSIDLPSFFRKRESRKCGKSLKTSEKLPRVGRQHLGKGWSLTLQCGHLDRHRRFCAGFG